jgi:RecB family exonuclease
MLDQYLRCPFAFYLQEVFGERSDDRRQELDALAFGNLCHEALDRFAKEGPADSEDPDEIAGFLVGEVRRLLSSFGSPLPAVIELQGEAAAERLRTFASLQAARRRAGWRIVASERKLECRIKASPTLLRGKVDRIDRHEKTGDLAIIDYKTWNRAKAENYDSVQLPVYRAMVEASGAFDPVKAREAKAFYCILAERPEDVMFDEAHAYGEGAQSAAEDGIVRMLDDIAKGIFYPPGKGTGAWERAYGSLVWRSLEEGLDPDWLADQKSRRQEAE